MVVDYAKLGSRIKMARINKGYTQEELAEIIKVSKNYISCIERNHSIPSLDTLISICNSLDTTPDRLLLDSIIKSEEYLMDEIAIKLRQCSNRNIFLIEKFIELLNNEDEDELPL
ncbi:MAG: helix-turn-helix domain-containing protein [Clostridiales bacterium]|jgi:transcriptional regulator with XRE-family HTH domain|nr:helix-turn-helix domain-containing protein [Clostridiales bacterium]